MIPSLEHPWSCRLLRTAALIRPSASTYDEFVAQIGKRIHASGFVMISVRGASSFECRSMMLFVSDGLLAARATNPGVSWRCIWALS